MSHVSNFKFLFFNFLKSKFRFNGRVVEQVRSTTYEHDMIYHLASYRGQPLTTGSSRPGHAKTEIMDLKSGKWTSGPDYPFKSE